MKIKTLAVQAVAALALCGLFAPSASADQSELGPYAYAWCGPKPPSFMAWFEEDHSASEWEEKQVTWHNVEMYKYCAVIVAALTEPEEVELGWRVRECVATYVDQPWDNESFYGPTGEPWTEAEIDAIEQCADPNAARMLRQDRRAKHRKHSKGRKRHSKEKKRHRPPSIGGTPVAIASGI